MRSRFSFKAWRQRGLSLVEIAILLAVVGLILGASIVPWSTLWVDDVYQREEEKIADIQDAILGYAAATSIENTKATVVLELAGGATRSFALPKRAYLPCPDVNGDGLEDRQIFPLAVSGEAPFPFALPSVGVVLSVSAGGNDNDNDLFRGGNCLTSRGTLPWKTLGVPPADHWGNRYTYEVDDVFSNPFVGFGRDSVVDAFDIRLPVAPPGGGIDNFLYQKRAANPDKTNEKITSSSSTRLSLTTYINNRRPIVVGSCGAAISVAGVSVALCTSGISTLYSRPIFYEAGRVATSPFAGVPRTKKLYAKDDVVEGVPYVVVSHGKNGRGAVSHNLMMKRIGQGVFGLVCNAPAYGTASDAALSVLFSSPTTPAGYSIAEFNNFPQVESTAPNDERYCLPFRSLSGQPPFPSGFFISHPRTAATDAIFDDVVAWESADELIRLMGKSGIFPAANFPVLRGY